MLLCKQEESGIQLNAEQADWKDDTDDKSDDQELEAHYMYMAKVQEVSPDVVDSRLVFDTEQEQKVQNDDHYNVFAIECQHLQQSESVHKTYLIEQDAHNVIIESVDMSYDSEQIDQNNEDADLAKERKNVISHVYVIAAAVYCSRNSIFGRFQYMNRCFDPLWSNGLMDIDAVSCTGKLGRGKLVLAGKSSMGTVWEVRVLGFGRNGPLEYINTPSWNRPAFYNDGEDDDEDYVIAITTDFLITDSLIMRDEHLDTILEKESDEFINSSVETLVPNPSEFEDECEDVPDCDDSQTTNFSTFPILSSTILPLEIISNEFNPIHNEDLDSTPKNDLFDTESYLLESLLNHDTLMASSLKIDSLLEFVVELIFLKSIPLGIDEADCDPEEDIRLIEILLYDNSSPRLPEEFVSENSNAEIESFSTSPILVEDSDSFMEEIDLSFNPDDPIPSSIKEDDDDSERDILIREELLDNYSLSFPENESFHFDIPSFSRPPAKPPDGNTGILNIKMMGDISKQKVPMPRLMITRVSNQEKSPDLLSHRSLEIFQLSAKYPMMLHGKNIHILDVPLFHFYTLHQFKYGGNWVKLSDLKQSLRGRHPMLIRSLVFSNE
nr:hypothetical protein [Tanacetum cinerariifolium]